MLLADASISEAGLDDVSELSQFAMRTYIDAFGADFPSAEELSHYLDATLSEPRWQKYLDQDRVFLARVAGSLAGYIQFGPDQKSGEAQIRRLYVDRRWHGQGLGTRLLTLAVDQAEMGGTTEIWIDVWQNNPGARRLYEAHGFVATAERTPFVLKSGQIDGYDIRMVRRRG